MTASTKSSEASTREDGVEATESVPASGSDGSPDPNVEPNVEADAKVPSSDRRGGVPGWLRPLILPLAMGALAALYLAAVQHAPLTPGVVVLCLGAAAVGLTAYYVVGAADALVRGMDDRGKTDNLGRRRRELLREKAAILKALKELEFDHETGKISDADFREIGERLRARARPILRALDDQGGDYRHAIEEELRRRRSEKEQP
jgi:hypothetical protein